MSKASKKRAQTQAQAQTRRNIILGISAVTVVAIMVLLVVFLSGGSGSDEISVDEAKAKSAQGAFILDVRTPEEWEQYHIADSTLIPLDELEARVDEVPRDQEVVVVCRSGNRSQQGRDILKNAGFTNVLSMRGRLLEWQAQGYPVVSGP